MWGRLRGAILVGVMGALVAVWALPAAADSTATFADLFGTQSFSGNDGDATFTGPWTEFGESNGPDSGPVSVWSDPHCAGGSGWCLTIGGEEVNIDGHGVVREADTSGATSAVLRYSFRRALFGDYTTGAWVKVQVSGDGGGTWKTVDRHKFGRNDGSEKRRQHDITAFIGARTQVRFIGGPADQVAAYIYIDDVAIEMEMAPPSTTTTTTPETTTTTTTTTTIPPAPTTTTSAPTTTTTAVAVAVAAATTTTAAGPEPVATSLPPAAAGGPPEARTTTTTTSPAVAADFPPARGATGDEAPEPGTYESFISKSGLTVTSAMPTYYISSDPATDTSGAGVVGSGRTPVERLGATFSTATETLRSYSVSAVFLGVLVAWLALRGLGRTRHRSET